jgi:sulfur relay (sulfurtransferase) complex TusBCD TusD component (DsrE family)
MAPRRTPGRGRSRVLNILVILQGPAYGDERACNGVRLAANLAKRDGVNVRVFCFGDAIGCALAG